MSLQHLTKQNVTLREINDSRVKVYEQLEVSIIDLEATNKQLVEESKADKNRINRLDIFNRSKNYWEITHFTNNKDNLNVRNETIEEHYLVDF